MYEATISELVLRELEATTDAERRRQMLVLADPLTVLEWQPEMDDLAAAYITAGAFSPALRVDAQHVAAAVVAGAPILVSWNFRHMVNRARRIRVNLVNSQQGHGQLDIVAPPELEEV